MLIATPGQFHEPVLVPALEAGLPILCEKPLTPDSESSWRILELEQKLAQAAHPGRLHAPIRSLSTGHCASSWHRMNRAT